MNPVSRLVSHGDAILFQRYTAAVQEVRVSDFARVVAAARGPMDDLDGSVPSLTALWEWLLEWVGRGAPGWPADAKSSWGQFLGQYWPPEYERLRALSELVGAYVFEVARGADPSAQWVRIENDRGRDERGNHIGLAARHRKPIIAFYKLANAVRGIRTRPDGIDIEKPNHLLDWFQTFFLESDAFTNLGRADVDLLGVAAAGRYELTDPRRVVPAASFVDIHTGPVASRATLALVHAGVRAEDRREGVGADRAVAVLDLLAVRDEAGDAVGSDRFGEGLRSFAAAPGIAAEVETEHDRVTAVYFAPTTASDDVWGDYARGLRKTARQEGLSLRRRWV